MLLGSLRTILMLLLAASSFTTLNAAPNVQEVQRLYDTGRINSAKKIAASELEAARNSNNQLSVWNGLMVAAWLESVTGEFHKSIEYSNEALSIALKLNSPMHLGRTYCWLGWAYAGVGLYDAAESFYAEAIKLGATPDGQVLYPFVWGLATQEYGALLFKMGSTADAEALLQKSTDYARLNGIKIGISEGTAHLAEIAIHRGTFEAALDLADEAVEASYECNCSHFNTARALYMAVLVRSKMPELKAEAITRLAELINYARKNKVLPVLADALLLQSKISPEGGLQAKQDAINEAITIVTAKDLERQGRALVEASNFLRTNNSLKLAQEYLELGVKISEEKLRTVDRAYILNEESAIELAKSDASNAIKKKLAAYDSAKSTLGIDEAAQIAEELAVLFYDQKNLVLAGKWALQAIRDLEKLNEDSRYQSETSTNRQARILKAQQLFVECQLFTSETISPLPTL